MDLKQKISRRQFIGQANCAAVGTASLLSSLLSLRLTAGAASASNFTDDKALVCLFLNGGNDSFNMLVPRQQNAYNQYVSVRGGLASSGGLALSKDDPTSTTPGEGGLWPITSSVQSQPGGAGYSEFGIHPDLPYLKTLYDQGDLAFVSNVGSLIEPTTLAQYNAKSKPRPEGLFSHPDHQIHWQTLVPQVRGSSPKGWAGRMAEVMSHANQQSSIAMNISLSGANVLQSGPTTVPYITDPGGVVELRKYDQDPTLKLAVDDILGQHYQSIYSKTLAQANRKSIDASVAFKSALDSLSTPFDPTALNGYKQTYKRLSMVTKIMEARTALSMNRQIFFVERGGWDHHNELLAPQSDLFTEINDAIEIFWSEVVNLGLENNVVLYTASDFGRTLTSNGSGSDHAWGGNHFIISGSVAGGEIYGSYPALAGGSNDLGRGRILPSTSVDAYMGELASWYGVPSSEISTVIPNINNFNFANLASPLGILTS
ncbi:MAG: DUF1501 domain-containing protein [Verrucomicrobiota bacterium]|nr:DUF1501 domain-containing protein [Verrucomicrobiota bacterium]